MRADTPWESAAVNAALKDKVEAIIFTDRKAKHGVVTAAGYYPSVWIDDMPSFIHNDAYVTPSAKGIWE